MLDVGIEKYTKLFDKEFEFDCIRLPTLPHRLDPSNNK